VTLTSCAPRRLALLTAVVMSCLCLGLTAAPRASAHGEDGYFEDLGVQTASGLDVTVEALLRYEDDDDPAPGATVTLVAQGPQGEVVGPVRMAAGSQAGRYTATATFPTAGTWALRLSSLEPDGVLRSTVEIPADTVGAPAGNAPDPTTAEPPSPRGAMAVEATARSTGAASVGTWAAAAAAVALVAAAVWLAVARRR
jgi:hypothetical protein